MAVTDAAVLAALTQYTFFESIQTAAESEAGSNADADLLYRDFQVYYEDAADQLTDVLAVSGKLVLSDIKKRFPRLKSRGPIESIPAPFARYYI